MTISSIIFDLGGVIVRTEESASREKLAQRLGVSRWELEDIVFSSQFGQAAQRGEISTDRLWERVRAHFDLPPDEIPQVKQAFWGGDRVDRELVAYIRSLRPRYKTALLSNAWNDLRLTLERWGIIDAFDHLTISGEVGITKPNAAIYHYALAGVGAAPHQAVFVDDFIENVEGARAVGMQAIHFQNRQQAIQALEEILAG